jgi:hypothetical protein
VDDAVTYAKATKHDPLRSPNSVSDIECLSCIHAPAKSMKPLAKRRSAGSVLYAESQPSLDQIQCAATGYTHAVKRMQKMK